MRKVSENTLQILFVRHVQIHSIARPGFLKLLPYSFLCFPLICLALPTIMLSIQSCHIYCAIIHIHALHMYCLHAH